MNAYSYFNAVIGWMREARRAGIQDPINAAAARTRTAIAVRIGVASPTGDPSRASSVPHKLLLELRRQQMSFTDISGWTRGAVTMDTGDGTPRILTAALAGGNGFQVLGMNAYVDRLLTPADDVRSGSAGGWPAVLDYAFWTDNFGADPSVLGRQIKLSDNTVTIVGVAPPGFPGACGRGRT